MEIRPLDKVTFAGKAFTVRYRTGGYWDISRDRHGFAVRHVPFDAPVERSFDDVFFSEWLEDPAAFGAFSGGQLLGFVEGSPEGRNRRSLRRAHGRAGNTDLQRECDRVLSKVQALPHRLRLVRLYERRPAATRDPAGDGEKAGSSAAPTIRSDRWEKANTSAVI